MYDRTQAANVGIKEKLVADYNIQEMNQEIGHNGYKDNIVMEYLQ